ncbi:MAG: pyrrolo-quinoline quinone, partial [Planctomycetia bacterium]|nr:pyrrolo-quinoline quinone [Planctomycetia bacterium]
MRRIWSRLIRTCLLALGLVAGSTAEAADWPQWQGPGRDGIWRETGTVEQIPATGLPVRWRIPIEGGYAGPAVVGGRVFVTDYVQRDGELANDPGSRTLLAGNERVLCLDATTGQVLWKHEYDCPYSISYAAGPRCTPTVQDGRVYIVGAEGNLICLEASTGKLLWQKDFKRDYAAPTPIWGFCGHPLVVDDLLICLVGGEGSVAVAFDRISGEERW